MVPLNWYLILSAFVFSCGLYAALARRNAIAALMGIELMLNAVNINLVAFWRYGNAVEALAGQVFAIFVIAVAAAEVAVGLALIISVYRLRRTVNLDELDTLRG
ncbi:NADH-quinone oxidoreductase subunit NuoK [Litorilinea aerophila]|uniref:NADH-quinone oxidoreductase subunit K n=1 Tax=Litorilinea aerophila TaxID=1204385 RepID=A0A540VAM4_9CHLR|nr:NADH-quinone oxidoreductase subunit NuoK [Litorilinea aerophila]MCC9078328.1 NADH-quinone oxidoreductase subunit NuoK [Litorilinea aerophila]OUC05415.1 NADH-ubiquinone oxidoreductase subunit 4L [Litorilinea aerophila]GIV77128.1 MAG: NADH-quinone oxidoreductase subunit K [Litorilinea sp.]